MAFSEGFRMSRLQRVVPTIRTSLGMRTYLLHGIPDPLHRPGEGGLLSEAHPSKTAMILDIPLWHSTCLSDGAIARVPISG
jgi:hypothetical protein